jgi:RNA polymerase subunit RPABC4/transcription elongation factor Spt4
VPSCINPDHLFLGSHQDNVDDKVAKQRQTMGTDCHSSKLTEPQIGIIRAMNEPQQQIADKFGISQTNVGWIKRRVTWKHVL